MCSRFRPYGLLLTVLLVSTAYVATAYQSECYTLDRGGYLYDFTDLRGKEFQYVDQDGTYIVRFCKDVQFKSGKSIVNYGRFSPLHSSARDASNALLQEYRYGDLQGCENESYDNIGRGSMVSITCDPCPNSSPCQDPDGCICFVKANPSKCLTTMILGLNCKNRGPRIYSGVTVGFSPRGKEVVDNGLTQWGYDTANPDYSFVTQHSRVVLYLSAQSTLASKIGKPDFKVFPDKGLKVQLSGTASNGVTGPTVMSPTILEVNWQCEKKASTPFSVNVTIPVGGSSDAIVFTLGKHCDFENDLERSGSSGWATFGFLVFILIVGLTMFCCAGFLYRTRIEDKHGVEALPGFTTVTTFIESTRHSGGYAPADDITNPNINVSDSSSSGHSQRLPRSSDGPSYGAV